MVLLNMFVRIRTPLIAKSFNYDGQIHARMAKRSTSHEKPNWIEINAQLLASEVLKENTTVCSNAKKFHLVPLRVNTRQSAMQTSFILPDRGACHVIRYGFTSLFHC